MRRLVAITLALMTACSTAVDTSGNTTPATTAPNDSGPVPISPEPTTPPASGEPSTPTTYPPAPVAPEGPIDPRAEEGLRHLAESMFSPEFDGAQVQNVIEAGDPRAAWLIADLLRFFQFGPPRDELVHAFEELTGAERIPTGTVDFVWAFNNLIAWDLPAWDGYADLKAIIYERVDSRWSVFFQEDHGVDWRLVTWGGVLADDRPMGDNGPCNCIPALDDPATTDASGGDWYDDERVVFGVVVNGEALALPKHQMEVHEMVNITLGGRDIGIPYCTLCGSAQAYFTDNVPGFDRVVLRTSGLLSRSNKMMYDLTTRSVIDTFTGEALTGPLGATGVVLEQVTVVASRWGDWKRAHPNTRIVAHDGGIGRVYPDDPLGGRDDSGPIFPVGDVDPRLPVQEDVVGVITPDGIPIAFPVNAVRAAFSDGDVFEFGGVTVRLTDGIRVFDGTGAELPTHQAFWFAWSQFHPDTLVWTPLGS